MVIWLPTIQNDSAIHNAIIRELFFNYNRKMAVCIRKKEFWPLNKTGRIVWTHTNAPFLVSHKRYSDRGRTIMVSAWEIKTMDVRKGRRAFQKKNFFIQSMRILFSVSFFMAGLCYELACAFVSIGLGLLLAVQLKKQPLRFYVNDAAVFACSIPAF